MSNHERLNGENVELAKKLTSEQVQSIHNAFDKFDVDSTGEITEENLQAVMDAALDFEETFHVKDKMREILDVWQADRDDSGSVDFNEYFCFAANTIIKEQRQRSGSDSATTDDKKNVSGKPEGQVAKEPTQVASQEALVVAPTETVDEPEEDSDYSDNEEDPWYANEDFWLGDDTSEGLDWDQHGLSVRVGKIVATRGVQVIQKAKTVFHYGWITYLLYLGMNHPVNGVTPSFGDLLGASV